MRFYQHFILYVLVLFVFSNSTFAQKKQAKVEKESCVEISDKKAIKLYEQGKDKKKYEKNKRMEFLKEAIETEPDYVEALSLYAEELIKTARADGTSFKHVEKYLLKIVVLCPEYDNYAYFYLGQIAYNSNKYTDAAKNFDKFLKYPDEIKNDADLNLASESSKKAKEYAEIFEKPVPFNPICVEHVSTKDDEYLAIISPDNELMFFTRRMAIKSEFNDQAWQSDKEKLVERFTMSRRNENIFEKGQSLPSPFNRGDNYGGATVTPDNKHMYLTVCKDTLLPKKYLNCDIYTSDFINGEWGPLRNLGTNINTADGWESQPSISSDNKTLYFSSFREESQGMDIYSSSKTSDGVWQKAKNMGSPINSEKHEKSPFIHSDSHTLYFSSDGHTGVGGLDIFMVKDNGKAGWTKPKNLGFPINTENDEVGFFVSTDGKTGYFSSNSLKGKCKGGYDIFSFDLYKEARPEEVMFVKGEVKSDNGDFSRANVKIRNINTKNIVEVEVDSIDGKYVAIIVAKKEDNLVLSVKKEGKAFSSEIIHVKEELLGKPRDFSSQIKEVIVGAAYKLNNINYATNSAELTFESKEVLNDFIHYLEENPSISIAIHGHTDDVGNDAANLALSTDRAFSVLAYLQEKGIDRKRLTFKGFGKNNPLVPNTSEQNRAANRRTEFLIISK
ncbi:MAG: OmpA family protein [Bacteroidetes bacterium]|nr:OmpA family protein [Bacteroidota bacterium]HET6243950.1 OmpA family protein [Bacteroidia bacterium]